MKKRLLLLAVILVHGELLAGPYSAGLHDPANASDAPVPGFVGTGVNPIFVRWALTSSNYVRSDGQSSFNDESLALGPVTGDNFDVLSLGDLTAAQITSGASVGKVTLHFTDAQHTAPIRNLPGADFVIFENGFEDTTGAGGVFAELAYVEVSSDGVNFARFPSVSLTPAAVGSYGALNPTNVFNLAGKHVNADGDSWGTPFDLAGLVNHPLVTAGTLDLNNVRYVRIVDIPGNGAFFDSAAHPIYDSWRTTGSGGFGTGGFDLEAVGAISIAATFDEWQNLEWQGAWKDHRGLEGAQRGALADPDRDGVPNLIEYAFAMHPLKPDAEVLPKATLTGGDLAISFRRDTRLANATVEVLGTSDLQQPWQTIARAQNGGALLPVIPFSPVIEDASDSPIVSVGVIRRNRVHAAPGQHFLKINVILAP